MTSDTSNDQFEDFKWASYYECGQDIRTLDHKHKQISNKRRRGGGGGGGEEEEEERRRKRGEESEGEEGVS